MTDTTETAETHSTELIRIGPWWTLPLVLVASVTLNLAIWWAALQFGPPGIERFFPLAAPLMVILLTAAGAVGAYALFWVLAQLTTRPAGLFISTALVGLVISFAPNVMLSQDMGGWSEFAVGALILMHVAAALVNVGLLLWIFHYTRRLPAG